MNPKVLAAIALLSSSACAHKSADSPPPRAEPREEAPLAQLSASAASAPPPSALQLGPTATELIPLPVPGFLPAVLFVPEGTQPRPLVVVGHGAGGDPESMCAYWVRLTQGRAFVLSLRGTPFNSSDSAFFYRDHLALGRELAAALPAARAAFGERFVAGAGLYSGFSQGATMAVGMIPPFAEALPHLVMIEGGYDYWSVAHARSFAKQGGKRVLIACGTSWCAEKAGKAAEWLRKAGVEARVEYAPGAGHTPGGEVAERVAAALPWVVAEQSAWMNR